LEELEGHVALVRLYETANRSFDAEVERDSCVDQIDSEFERLWTSDDSDEITRKIEEIDAAIETLQISDRWANERTAHEERRQVDSESGHREGSSRVDSSGTRDDDQSIADLFSTW
jgi:hypothetical protein